MWTYELRILSPPLDPGASEQATACVTRIHRPVTDYPSDTRAAVAPIEEATAGGAIVVTASQGNDV